MPCSAERGQWSCLPQHLRDWKKSAPFPADFLRVESALGSWYLFGQLRVHPGYQFLIEDFCPPGTPYPCRLSQAVSLGIQHVVSYVKSQHREWLPEVQSPSLGSTSPPHPPHLFFPVSDLMSRDSNTPALPKMEPLCPPHMCWGYSQ